MHSYSHIFDFKDKIINSKVMPKKEINYIFEVLKDAPSTTEDSIVIKYDLREEQFKVPELKQQQIKERITSEEINKLMELYKTKNITCFKPYDTLMWRLGNLMLFFILGSLIALVVVSIFTELDLFVAIYLWVIAIIFIVLAFRGIWLMYDRCLKERRSGIQDASFGYIAGTSMEKRFTFRISKYGAYIIIVLKDIDSIKKHLPNFGHNLLQENKEDIKIDKTDSSQQVGIVSDWALQEEDAPENINKVHIRSEGEDKRDLLKDNQDGMKQPNTIMHHKVAPKTSFEL